jgi:TetR/AcrR family transcriptional regulator
VRSSIDAAKLFAERGYARTSMSEIAAACGSSKALLYHYYENKEQLLYDLLEVHFIKLEESVKAADALGVPPVERLRGLIAALLAATRAPMPCTRRRSTSFRRCRCRASRN